MRSLLASLFLLFFTDCYSQAIGPWTQKAQFPGPGRHRGFGFVIGDKAYIGGGWNSAQIWDDFWEYDPASNSWTQKGTLPGGAALASVGFSIGNFGYFTLGLDANFVDIYTLWEYNPVTNTWTPMSTYPGFAGWGYEGFVIGSRAYIGEEWTNDLHVWDQNTNTWTLLFGPVTYDRDEVALSDGTFGYWAAAMPSGNGLWKYNPSGNTWTQLPFMPAPGLTEASGFAVGGKLFVGSGQYLSTGERTDRFWEFNPATNQWREVNPIPGLERDDAIGLSLNNRGYLFTGTNGNNLQDAWEFNPAFITGVTEGSSALSCTVFPNPVQDKAVFRIEGFAADRIDLLLFDNSGKLLREQQFQSTGFTFFREDLPAGLYYYKVIAGSGHSAGGKIILL